MATLKDQLADTQAQLASALQRIAALEETVAKQRAKLLGAQSWVYASARRIERLAKVHAGRRAQVKAAKPKAAKKAYVKRAPTQYDLDYAAALAVAKEESVRLGKTVPVRMPRPQQQQA